MRIRSGLMVLAAAVLGTGVVALPAIAGSETAPTIDAVNEGGGIYGERHLWSPATATVTVGGSVTISNPGAVPHGVRWVSGPGTPSCDAGVPVGSTEAASGPKWSGSCTFSQAGTYTFYCTVHGAAMRATVTVGSGETTTNTATTPTVPVTTTPVSNTPAGAPPTGQAPGVGAGLISPLIGPTTSAIKLRPAAHGTAVHGSVEVSAAGAGARLQVDLFATGAARIRVGHLVRSSLHEGVVPFTVALDARGRRALHSHARLRVSVAVTLTPLHGEVVKRLVALQLRR